MKFIEKLFKKGTSIKPKSLQFTKEMMNKKEQLQILIKITSEKIQ
jgi:hypothetical protein